MPPIRTLAVILAALAAPAGAVAATAPAALQMPASALPAGYEPVPGESGPVSQAEAIARASTPALRAITRRCRLAGARAVYRQADPPEQTETRATVYRGARCAAQAYAEGLRILAGRADRLDLPPVAPGARAFRVRQGDVEAVLVAWRRGPAVLTMQVSGPSVAPAVATVRARRQDARATRALGIRAR